MGDAVVMRDGSALGAGKLLRPDGTPPQVLVVDDEAGITDALVSALRFDGFEARGALDARSAMHEAERHHPDLVILDVMLPDLDGFEVLHRMRKVSEHVCVLFLTARDSVEDRIRGISAGGDDYVTKPFSLQEVLARSRGLIRRAGLAQSRLGASLQVGDLAIDEDAHEVRRNGDLIDLTATEFALLSYLAHNQRRVVSKAQILDNVWDYDFGGQAHVVELYISYLRKKIDADRHPMIHTIRGVGYVLKTAKQ